MDCLAVMHDRLPGRHVERDGTRGVDLFIDPVAGPGFKDHLDLLAPVGMLVLYGMIEELPTNGVFRTQCERWGRSPAVRMFSIHAYDDRPDVSGQHLAHLMEMIKDGRIKPAIFAELPLDMAAEAHSLIDEGTVMGKILLQPARTEPRYALSSD